jgi:hypothetical protein
MMIRRWAWLIGKTDATDDVLLDWAQSFSSPPALEERRTHRFSLLQPGAPRDVAGGRVTFDRKLS